MTLLPKILAAVLVVVCCACGVQTYRLRIEQDEHKLTQRDLADATRKVAEWVTAEEYSKLKIAGQAALGQACLAREKAAEADATLRAQIMGMSPPVTITPDEEKKGVSRETRRAVADYLNRPL